MSTAKYVPPHKREATSVIETDRWGKFRNELTQLRTDEEKRREKRLAAIQRQQEKYRSLIYLLDGSGRVPLEDDDQVEKFGQDILTIQRLMETVVGSRFSYMKTTMMDIGGFSVPMEKVHEKLEDFYYEFVEDVEFYMPFVLRGEVVRQRADYMPDPETIWYEDDWYQEDEPEYPERHNDVKYSAYMCSFLTKMYHVVAPPPPQPRIRPQIVSIIPLPSVKTCYEVEVNEGIPAGIDLSEIDPVEFIELNSEEAKGRVYGFIKLAASDGTVKHVLGGFLDTFNTFLKNRKYGCTTDYLFVSQFNKLVPFGDFFWCSL